MAYTQSDLDNLDKAIANGITRVKINNKEITYRSLDEMKQIRAEIRKELGVTKRRPPYVMRTTKGL